MGFNKITNKSVLLFILAGFFVLLYFNTISKTLIPEKNLTLSNQISFLLARQTPKFEIKNITNANLIYRKVPTTASHCNFDFKKNPLMLMQSKSQDKEDLFIQKTFFKNLCRGTYVELGALDGKRFSNTYMFRHVLNWRGVLIEPSPQSFSLLQQNRPDDKLVNAAVCSQNSRVHFLENGENSDRAINGIVEFMSFDFVKHWHNKLANQNNVLSEIQCLPLSSILDYTFLKKKHIDFLSLDVEGAEFEVIQTVDFNKHQFGLIFYEADKTNPSKDEAVKTFLEKNGYPFKFHNLRSNFHINKFWDKIYKNVI